MWNMFGYGHPKKNQPQWYTGYMVFQDGNPRLKRSSMTGGGMIYQHDNPGRFQPVVVLHTSVTASLTGPGSIPSRFPFLTHLLANPSGSNNGA